MAGGKEKSGTYKSEEETEQYTIPDEAKKHVLTHVFGILIDSLINGILDYYIHDEDDDVRTVWDDNGISQNIEIRSYLGEKIKELNDIQGKNLSYNTKIIQIPTNVAFFSKAFKGIKILQRAQGSLQIICGQLDQFHFNECLERIVDGQNISLTDEAQSWIFTALHAMRTHTCSHEHVTINQPAAKEGIKIFQKEYMEKQNPVERYKEPGTLCPNTILSMNKALRDRWTREIYFYYKPYPNHSDALLRDYEVYINDVDINKARDPEIFDVGIWAYDTRDGTRKDLGKKIHFLEFYGIQRFVQDHLFNPDTQEKRIMAGTISSEGSLSKAGGYDTINEYDDVGLSIGLFHFSQTDLYNILRGFSANPIFNELIGGPCKLTFPQRGVIQIDDEQGGFMGDSPVALNYEMLRKLKLVYGIIKATDNSDFRKYQLDHALDWLVKIRDRTVRGKRVKDYITSEYGTALLLDLTVKRGRGNTGVFVNNAVEAVLAKGFTDTPAAWGNDAEEEMIQAVRDVRQANLKEKALDRETRINTIVPNLSHSRNSFT